MMAETIACRSASDSVTGLVREGFSVPVTFQLTRRGQLGKILGWGILGRGNRQSP